MVDCVITDNKASAYRCFIRLKDQARNDKLTE